MNNKELHHILLIKYYAVKPVTKNTIDRARGTRDIVNRNAYILVGDKKSGWKYNAEVTPISEEFAVFAYFKQVNK